MGNHHDEIESRLRPGAWDTEGFLLHGESLTEQIARDLADCTRLGVTPQTIGLRLAELIGAAVESDVGRAVRIDDYDVDVIRQRGLMTCPWAADEFHACPVAPAGWPTANRFRLRRGVDVIEGFELSAHLIGAHQFFGGVGTRFRIDPRRAAAILGPH